MFQLTFSDSSMKELNKLDKLDQLALMQEFSELSEESLKNPDGSHLGKTSQKGKTLYRLRAKDYRIYFEIKDYHTLHAHHILAPHTLKDFLIRSKLPVNEEFLEEKDPSFWQYLDSLRK